MAKLQIHPLANMLPRMTDAELSALLANVREVGRLIEPIVLLDGKILDGRHRADVCEELGITPATVDYDPAWGSPVKYVYSRAVHRNLTDSQKAAAAVLIEEEIGKEAKERSAANLKQNLPTKDTKSTKDGGNFATSELHRVEGKTRKQWEMWLGSLSMKRLEAEWAKRSPDGAKLGNLNFKEMKDVILGFVFPPKPEFIGDLAKAIVAAGGSVKAEPKLEPLEPGRVFRLIGTLPDIPCPVCGLRIKAVSPDPEGYKKGCFHIIAELLSHPGNKAHYSYFVVRWEKGAWRIGEDRLVFDNSTAAKSRDIAGNLFGVSGRYVQDAKLVYKQQPKLFADVMAGKLTLSRAKSEVRRHVKREVLKKIDAAPAVDAKWEIITGDCVETMEGMARRSFNLIFADPPYNIDVDYGIGEKADLLPDDEYLAWCRKWIGQCADVLSPVGTMLVLINDEWADYFGLMLRDAGLHRRAWLKWYESFGVNCNDNFNRCSRHLFYCVKTTTAFTFNAAAFNRRSDRQDKYGDPRANPKGKIWDNVWGINPPIPRLVDNARERLPDFKTQLPRSLLDPIIAGFSNPGDLVLDPFSGSGTTVAAAHAAGRVGTGIEKNPARAKQSRIRLKGGL